MPLDFPNDPAVGDIFAGAGARWQWDGFKWTSLMTSGGPFLPLSGGALTGPLMLAADPVVALHAATKQYVDARGSGYLPLTGGTLAGPLTVGGILEVTTGHLQLINDGSTEDAFAYVDLSADIGGMNLIRGHSPGFAQTWWTLALGDGPPSADFSITRYDDAGGIIDHPLTISRATGVVTFGPIPPSTMRRLGEAPGVTATAGVGTLQGHTVNGTVIQGQGSTNDFMLNNKNGTAVMSVPTGTVNLAAAGLVTAAAASVNGTVTIASSSGHGLNVTAIPPGMIALRASPGNLSMTTTTSRLASLSANFSGTSTDALPSFAQIIASGDTVNATTGGGLYHLYLGHSFGGSTLKGGRTTLGIFTQMTATSGNTAGTRYYVGFGPQITTSVNDGGVSGTLRGNLFGENIIASLKSGATFWNSIVGSEIDVIVTSGASVGYKQGLKITLINSATLGVDAVRGSICDYAFGFGESGTSATGSWANGVVFVSPDGVSPWASDSVLIGSPYSDIHGSHAFVADRGVDLTNFTFTTAFLLSQGFKVDGAGNTSMARAGFNGVTAIAKPTVSGAKASNAALASLLTALANYGLITDTTTA